jgi:HD-like signal output (HDOD) protein
MSDLTEIAVAEQKDVERVLASVDIPVCPSSVTQVMREAQKDDPDLRELARLLSADVGMSAMAIKLANSPLFGGHGSVRSVAQAAARLGTRNIVSIVVAGALRASMNGLPPGQLEAFWTRASTLAEASGLVARMLPGIHPDNAYTFALFHDAAMPVMMRRFPEYLGVLEEVRCSGNDLCNAELQHFNCSHPLVGGLLANNWGLPKVITQAIRFHHDLDIYDLDLGVLVSEGVSLVAVTRVAEHLAADVLGDPGCEADLAFELAQRHLGLSGPELEDVTEQMLDSLRASARQA